MIVRALVRDRKRIFTLLLALLIVGFALPASFISGNTAPVKFVDEGLQLASPTVEYTVEVFSPPNATLAERLNILEKVYQNYTKVSLPGDLIHGKGGVLALKIALHALFIERTGFFIQSHIHLQGKEGRYVYSLLQERELEIPRGRGLTRVFTVYDKNLVAISPLSNDTRYLEWTSGSKPTPGQSPLQVAVDERFADYMGWRLGDTVEFLGIHARIVGIYKYRGGLNGLENSYPVFLVAKKDLLRVASMEAEYINSLDHRRLNLSLALILGTPSGRLLKGITISNGTSIIIPWIPLNPGKVPKPLQGDLAPVLAGTLQGDFYADLNREAVNQVVYHLSPQSLSEWRQKINSQVYERVARSLGVVLNGWRGSLIVGGEGTYYESYIYRVRAGGAVLLLTASEESGLILYAVENQYNNALSVFSLAVAVITIFVLGWLTGSDLLKIIIEDWRPRLAVLVARGSSSSNLHRGVGKLLAILVALGGVLGYIMALAIPASESLPVSMGANRYIALTTLAILFIVYLLLYRASGRLTSSIRPVEAIRPVHSIASARRPRRGISLFAALIVFSSLLIGVAGGPEKLFNAIRGTGPLVEVLFSLIVVLGMLGIPLAPLLTSYLSATVIAGYSRLYRSVARRVTRLAGILARYAYVSARRLEGRFLAGLLVPVMAGSLLMGVSLAIPALGGVASRMIDLYAGTGSFEYAASIASMNVARAQLEFTAIVSWLFLALSLYALLASVFALLENEVLVARIRGASPRQALGFALGVLSQAGAHSFAASIGGAVLTWLVLLGVFNLVSIPGLTGSPYGMAWLAGESLRHWWPVAGFGLALATAFLVPLLVGLRVSRTRDLSRVVREGGVM